MPAPRKHPPPRPRAAADTPHCRHFGSCGGCSLLDQPYGWQLHDKVESAAALLGPLLGDVVIAHDPPPQQSPQHFRTKLLYPIRAERGGLPVVGIYAAGSHEVVPIDECRTQDRGLTAWGRAAQQVLRDLRLVPFDERSGKGSMRALWARLAAGSGELLLGVTTTPGEFPRGAELADRLLAAAARLPHHPGRPTRAVGVVRSISDRPDAFLLGDRHVPLRGRDACEDRVAGLRLRISAGSFYQVHRDANVLLYRPALAMCGDVRGQRVVDGYGGIGAFGLRLAQAGAAAVTVVEDNSAACRDAEWNARQNGFGAKVAVVRSPFASAGFAAEPDLMVVDPPRSGLQAAGVARVLAASPRRLLHVACSVESLRDDLVGLQSAYRVVAARLVDLFPHTAHAEMLTLLERRA